MCGRFVQKSEIGLIIEEFRVKIILGEAIKSYNIAPGQNAGVIINDGVKKFMQFRWGLIPSWAKDTKMGSKMINARAETLPEKPSFKSALKCRRCLIPADGFYEWKRSGKQKTPFYIYSRSEHPLGLAGLWDKWLTKQEDALYTFTIITTGANSLIGSIHDRMPAIIPEPHREVWLDPDIKDVERLSALLKPYAPSELQMHRVLECVNSPQNNGPEIVRPFNDDS